MSCNRYGGGERNSASYLTLISRHWRRAVQFLFTWEHKGLDVAFNDMSSLVYNGPESTVLWHDMRHAQIDSAGGTYTSMTPRSHDKIFPCLVESHHSSYVTMLNMSESLLIEALHTKCRTIPALLVVYPCPSRLQPCHTAIQNFLCLIKDCR